MGMSDSKKDASVLDWDVPALWWGDVLPRGSRKGGTQSVFILPG